MFSFFKRMVKKVAAKEEQKRQKSEVLLSKLADNLQIVQAKTGNSSDIVIRHIKLGKNPGIDAAVVYVDGIVNDESIHDFIVHTMMDIDQPETVLAQTEIINFLTKKVVSLGSADKSNQWEKILLSLAEGHTIIFVDQIKTAITVDTVGGDKRSVEEPSTQVTTRGPRDGFTESIRTNTALVRRRIKNPNLWVESMKIGKVTNTDVEIMYINGIVTESLVAEVRERLNKIDIDSILESGYIEQLIEDQPIGTFPTLYHTERPDVVAGNLLEGRVAIFVDGTPFVLLAPATFVQFFQAVEDYYARYDIASALRFLRILMFFISILAPSLYIAATTYHQEMIPTELLIVVAAQRESVPFPAFFEALMMEITFEILREAGVRMPRAVGNAISIVGALVIGQAAVQAGIVSPAMVIVVAITAIASFATPSLAMAISARLIRFICILAAATMGLYGVMCTVIVLGVHLCSLRSFGVPYMAPLSPLIPGHLKDTIIRAPLWSLKRRPRLLTRNLTRLGRNQKPQPPKSRIIHNPSARKGENDES